jgi:PAS domain S-box-containing protein
MTLALPGFAVKSQIHESAASVVYRAVRQADNLPVILKVLRQDYPTPEAVNRYQQEYEISRLLSCDGMIRAYEQLPYRHTYVIVFEDFGGESLRYWMRQWPKLYCPMGTAEFLQLAISLTRTLSYLHRHQVIHKDINPGNLVLNPATGQIKLIDFGIASRLSQSEQSPTPPSSLEGTLPYLSPEQTGRMNRVVDYRTDFYSLGVTFYELLTGRLPFPTEDMLEMVHCHLARHPVPPSTLNPTIPEVLSDLVIKLMAKNAEDRYQSAEGIQADLQRCLDTWQSSGTIVPFALAQQDFTGKLQIPQKLYGRELEVARLLAAFERVAECRGAGEQGSRGAEEVGDIDQLAPPLPGPSAPQSSSELLLLTGYSGIGKSSLVRELYRPITERRGYFISGKFDQYQQGVPYTAVVAAFGELVRQWLGESEAELQGWRDRILSAVGSNGQVIIDLLPDVEQIIGPQPPVPPLGAVETQNRFNGVLQNFVRACCSPDHPLTLFLDDLQWADSASLNLLKLVLTDGHIQPLLVLGAYRNNEVDRTHPLTQMLQALAQGGVKHQTLTLTPLGVTHLGQLLSDTVHQPVEDLAELAELVMQKTTGNPFFINQFLKMLHTQGFLWFHGEQRCWQWDMVQIQAANFTDNVVALMVDDIQRLPPSTQKLLQLAACIGAEFDLRTLGTLAEQSVTECLPDLSMATATGLLLPCVGQESYWQANRFRFVHDQIQQAAHELISPEHRQDIHLQLGRLLWQQAAEVPTAETLFEIVDHLNLGLLHRGGAMPASQTECQQVAELNLQAGIKAKESMAYQAASTYLQAGLTLLGATAWQEAYRLTLACHEEAAEAAYLSGQFESMDGFINKILAQTRVPLDRVRSYDIRIQSLVSQGKLQDAIAVGIEILNILGIQLPLHPTQAEGQAALQQLHHLMADWSKPDLLALPSMADPGAVASVQILAGIGSASYISGSSLLPLILLKILKLSLQFGNTGSSTIGYLGYALLLCGHFGEVEQGYQIGQFAAELVTQLNAPQFQAKVFNVLGGHIAFWKGPLLSTEPPLRAGYESGVETGDFEYAGYSLKNLSANFYFSGKPLPDVLEHLQTNITKIQQLRQDMASIWASVYWQAILNLVGDGESPTQLVGQAYDETERIPLALQQDCRGELYCAYCNKLILAYLLGQFTLAVENSDLAIQYAEAGLGLFDNTVYYFYDSLARLALSSPDLDRVNTNQEKLQRWATHAPMNFLHKYHLVEAEKARVLGHDLAAEDYYEQAIQGAKENGYLQEAALAYELTAHFYRQRNRDLIANTYLKEAHYAYSLWGATVKVEQLEAQFPEALARYSPVSPSPNFKSTHPSLASGSATGQYIDLQALFQATQAIAREIEIPRLQSTLMKILLESAGAQRGCLLLPSEQEDGTPEWLIHATGYSDLSQTQPQALSINVLQRLPLLGQVPVSLVNYVLRTQESVVMDDATQPGDFAADPYWQSHPTRSILCTPLLNQGTPVGLVYLENNLTAGVFTLNRLEIVQLLSGQAAISLHNAKLYGQLQQSEAQLRQSEQQVKQFLDAMPVGVSVFDHTGHFAYQNPKAQELQGMRAPEATTAEQLTKVFQVYKAGTNQPYPVEALPIVRALAGETIHVEDLELRRDNQTLPLEVSATPIMNEQGEVRFAIAAFADITQRQQARKLLTDYNRTLEAQIQERTESLRQSKERLTTAQAIARMGNWEMDVQTGAMIWSEQLFAIAGLSPRQAAPTYPRISRDVPPR